MSLPDFVVAAVFSACSVLCLITLYVLFHTLSLGEGIDLRTKKKVTLQRAIFLFSIYCGISIFGIYWFKFPLVIVSNVIFGITILIFLHLIYSTFTEKNIDFWGKALAFTYNFLGLGTAAIWFVLPSQFNYIGGLFGLITFFMGLYRW